MPIIGRRGLIIGIASLLAAPAIVRASSLMEIRGVPLVLPNPNYITPAFQEFTIRGWDQYGMPKLETIKLTEDQVLAGDWQRFYGQDADFLLKGADIAKGQGPIIKERDDLRLADEIFDRARAD
jgi:hypothetical protein